MTAIATIAGNNSAPRPIHGRGFHLVFAAEVICFEFLQRPENVLAGYLAWPHYRGADEPHAIKITHHKTGATVWHPLEETTEGRDRPVL